MNSRIDDNLARAEALVESAERGKDSRDPRDIKSRTIGQVLSQLDLDFPGISASKIRFLEERGLVHPKRTDTGYRKYSQTDIERLRYILTMQRDYYMPLKVIRQQVAPLTLYLHPFRTRCWTRFWDPPTLRRGVHTVFVNSQSTRVRPLSLFVSLLTSAFWMTRQMRNILNMMCLLPELALRHGIQPRHLRAFKSAADREISLVEIAVAPLASRRDAASQTQAQERADKIRKLCLQLHATLVESAMPTYN